ncbi:glycogen debranching protein [Muriicola soli]|uniref:Glycogen debranching protein n=1 Tax=Muriicola soli TaxID=2507538 RepID=A0A411E747_9FLAO|nr:glycogen debranching protein [Muriicola soli]QBA63343.1 glycogen debranching protein [Muriicola soli]
MKYLLAFAFAYLFILGCQEQQPDTFGSFLENSPSIQGKTNYLSSPFVTAGDRVYMVGYQDGSFPELGWHIKNEMGGLWDHPIKLMDGFDIRLRAIDLELSLDQATTFTNYPFANRHTFIFDKEKIKAERWQFVPDGAEGILVQLAIMNDGELVREMDVDIIGHADLRPTWLGERTAMNDSPDEALFQEGSDIWVMKDQDNPWFVAFGADRPSNSHRLTESNYGGQGVSGMLSYAVILKPGETKTITFTIAGSYVSEEAMLQTYSTLQANWVSLLKEKQDRYSQLAKMSKLTIPDKQLEQTFEWLKYNCDWLVRTVPEIGSGITAGIPDYPWWFGVDSEYALKGYMAVGQSEAVYKTIALLDSLSEVTNDNGRIVHEVSTNGAVFNEGNINETPQFASLIWEVYRWNGEKAFLKRYFPTIKKGLQWLMSEKDKDGNGFPDGFGMMEIHGLDSEMIDVAAYTQRAFADASKIAAALGEEGLKEEYEGTAEALRQQINTKFWSEEFSSYADFIGTDQQALLLIEDAIIRADTLNKPWAVKELKATKEAILANPSSKPRPFVLHHNWVVNTPMEMKIADPEKAIRALETAQNFVNPFGVFVTGIDRDASAGSDDGSFKGSKVFSYTGAVMTLPTGVQAVAENNYSRPDQALNYLERMTRTFSYALPGSMYEVSPDYGMMTQAWNIYSFAIPIVQQFFGIQPDAAEKKVVISPQMPDSWTEASLENVIIADNSVSVYYETAEKGYKIKVTQVNPGWEMILSLSDESEEKGFMVMTSEVTAIQQDGSYLLKTSGSSLEVSVSFEP